MVNRIGRFGAAGLLAVLTTVGLGSGCATKRYVRTQVDTSASDITARMDTKDRELQNSIDSNTGQINELSEVSREHNQKIAMLDSGLKDTDGKATQAMSVGQGAQNTASQAAAHASQVDMQFQNRHNYSSVHEQAVLFGFGSAKVDEEGEAILDELSQRIKASPNAILVLEGRTDSTGDPAYNIQLGEKRLDAVVRHLVVEQSVPMQQIYKMSFGEAKPVAANDTREGRAQNRAVLIRIMEPKTSSPAGTAMSNAAPMNQ
jgi:outer membrane protein OmpA-like peptidoglycan-associated protein